jgi:hypothetical protein
MTYGYAGLLAGGKISVNEVCSDTVESKTSAGTALREVAGMRLRLITSLHEDKITAINLGEHLSVEEKREIIRLLHVINFSFQIIPD